MELEWHGEGEINQAQTWSCETSLGAYTSNQANGRIIHWEN
jgi:hypothetical protein